MLLRALLAAALLFAPGAAHAATALERMEERLQRVEDELAIKRLIVEYAVRLDAKDLDSYLDLFAEDGIWQTGENARRGRAAIREMLEGMYGETEKEPFGYARYRIVSNMQVDVDGNRATARSRHLSLMRGPNGNPVPTLGGLYEDELVRVDGQWKILRRVDYPIMPTAEEWQQQMSQLLAQEQQ